MKQTIDLIYGLQQLDDEIYDLVTDEEAIPQAKLDLESEVRGIEGKLKALKQESLDLAKTRKEKEIELDALGQKRVKFQSQQMQVKSNREYDALKHEIEGLGTQISGFEDAVLEILERSEVIAREIADEEKSLKAANERLKQEVALLDQKAEGLRASIAQKSAERSKLIEGMEASLLTRYERIRDVKDGLAVATVQKGACGGCFRRIPPQEMQILKRNDRIMSCEGCGRILIWREEEARAAEEPGGSQSGSQGQ